MYEMPSSFSQFLKIYEGDPVQNPWCIHSNVKNSINDGNVNEKILILDQKEPQMSKDLSYKSLVTGKERLDCLNWIRVLHRKKESIATTEKDTFSGSLSIKDDSSIKKSLGYKDKLIIYILQEIINMK